MQHTPQTIDMKELIEQAMEVLTKSGEDLYIVENQGFDESPFFEVRLKDEYQEKLSTVNGILEILGYDSISAYMRDQKKSEEPSNRPVVNLGYALISADRTKYFFSDAEKYVEFYIEKDPRTSTADMWVKDGTNEDVQWLAMRLMDMNK